MPDRHKSIKSKSFSELESQVPAEIPTIAPERWFVIYVIARHEKAVAAQLDAMQIRNLLPLQKSVRQWKQRRTTVELPVFPCYVFVSGGEAERRRILAVPGVIRFVTFQNRAATVSAEELSAIVAALKVRSVKPCAYLGIGQRVRIVSGPLAGIVGVIDRTKGLRLVVSVDSIASSIRVEVLPEDLTDVVSEDTSTSAHQFPPFSV